MLKEVMQIAMENPEVTIASLVAFGMAFSVATRKAIGKRDKWHCQDEGCEASFQAGDMVHASHWNHDKSDPNYDTVEAGRIQCVEHHEQYHEQAQGHSEDIGLLECQNNFAISRLKQTPKKKNKDR